MTRSHSFKTGAVAALLAAVGLPATAAASAAPAARTAAVAQAVAPRATLGTCSSSFELWASTGTTSLPGRTTAVPVYGYGLAPGAVTAPGGPTLVACAGAPLTITLHNALGERTSLLVSALNAVPDTVGVAAGGTKASNFAAPPPGTYLYEAGLTGNSQHQVAMGLYGVLVVQPAGQPKQAYDAASTFDDEGVILTSELDPALNTAADPAAFDMRTYSPTYSLVNGQAASTVPLTVPSEPGHRVLLRYANAGLRGHSMATLGVDQKLIATDAAAYADPRSVVAETFGPGETADAIATVPLTATTGTKYAVYDASLNLNNGPVRGLGGMLAFVSVGTSTGGTSSVSPVVNSIATTAAPVTITGFDATVTIDGAATPAVRYFVDSTAGIGYAVPVPTSGVPFDVVFGTAGNAPVVTGAGLHTIYLQTSADGGLTWGVPAQLAFTIPAVVVVDTVGPAVTGVTASPNPTNGATTISIAAQASDAATGGGDIASATGTYTGVSSGTFPLTVTRTGTATANLTGTIPSGLAAGTYTVSVTARDAALNVSPIAGTTTLVVDRTGPSTGAVTATPNPTNGVVPAGTNNPSVRIITTVTDASTPVALAEGFIDTLGATGTGFVFSPVDGRYDTTAEAVFADIPLTKILTLANGNHTIYVRGKDALGNWDASTAATAAKVTLLVDRTAPTLSGASLTPATVGFGAGTTAALAVTASDNNPAPNGVVGGEYWIDGSSTPPAATTAFGTLGAGIATGALSGGNHTVYVRVRDAAGNWSAVRNVTLSVVRAVNDARAITSNTSATQTSDASGNATVLANDLPTGNGRTAIIASVPTRTGGTGTGTISITCPASLGTAAVPAIGGNTVCTNGAYRVTLTAPATATTNAARQAAKRGTYRFTYTMTLNGVTSTATVTITVS